MVYIIIYCHFTGLTIDYIATVIDPGISVSVLSRTVLRVGVDVRYRRVFVIVLVFVVIAATVTIGHTRARSAHGNKALLLIMSRHWQRLARPVLAPVAARVRDSVQRNAVHRTVDHGHQMFERGAQLLQIVGQHGRGVGGQAAPETNTRTHPVQREPRTGHVQQQVRVRRRLDTRWAGAVWRRQVGQYAARSVGEGPPCTCIATL